MIRGLTLDTGALIAIEHGDPRVRALLVAAVRDGRPVTVPTSVVAEAWRGGSRRSAMARLLDSAHVEPLSAGLARAAGELLGRTSTSQSVDAIVAVSAAQRSDVVVTSDPHDLQRLADAVAGVRVLTV